MDAYEGCEVTGMAYIRSEDAYTWSSTDDLDTMDNAEEMLEAGEIDSAEEGFINGYLAA